MIGFTSVLSTNNIRDIRAYLIQRAQTAAARH